jgi:hypothetical protein
VVGAAHGREVRTAAGEATEPKVRHLGAKRGGVGEWGRGKGRGRQKMKCKEQLLFNKRSSISVLGSCSIPWRATGRRAAR